jgi:hypothetical protein
LWHKDAELASAAPIAITEISDKRFSSSEAFLYRFISLVDRVNTFSNVPTIISLKLAK